MLSSVLSAAVATSLLIGSASALGAPFAKPWSPINAATNAFDDTFNDTISYNMSAKVMTHPVKVYFVYYGNWTAPQKSILEDYIHGIQKTSWWAITKKYYFQKNAKSRKIYVNGAVSLAKTVVDNYSQSDFINSTSLIYILQDLVDKKKLPESSRAVYFVLTSDDVNHIKLPPRRNGYFGHAYCGYHNATTLNSGKRIYYAFVGNPAQKPRCIPYLNPSTSPNNDVGVDAVVSMLSHELTETVTDPEVHDNRSWTSPYDEENADMCAWTFGTTQTADNGSQYNMVIKNRKFLVQQNWDPVKQQCASSA